MSPTNSTPPRFTAPFDWPTIEATVATDGAAIVEGLFSSDAVDTLNADIDAWLEAHAGAGAPRSGNAIYDVFLGHNTIRLHGMAEKVAATRDWIARPELVAWAERAMAPLATSIRLNAAELIQIGPGEPAQIVHRDSDSWPLPIGPAPVVVNAIVALDACTRENGATYIAAGSHAWAQERQAEPHEYVRAVMAPGDAVLFRGDAIHGGGENASTERRRALSISYCAGWLRPVENSYLNVSIGAARACSPELQKLLGYAVYDGTSRLGGIIGQYECGDPMSALD